MGDGRWGRAENRRWEIGDGRWAIPISYLPSPISHVEVESGEFVEINILGEAIREGKPLTIVGEAKIQLHRRDLLRFLADRVEPARKIFPEVFPVLVTYMTTAPDLEEEIRQSGVALYYSFDLG